MDQLEANCRHIRAEILKMCHQAGTAHLASSLSCVEILVAAYFKVLKVDPQKPQDPDRDRLILSKGHAVASLYAVLATRGYFAIDNLKDYNRDGGHLPEQPSPGCMPGIELATGSLGHGLSVGLGQALAGRIQKRDFRVVAVLSDGECNEGSVWEAALFAAAQRVNQLTVVVDYNKWQATGRSQEVMALDPLAEKWRSFGWAACEVDGHDLNALTEALQIRGDRPHAIVAHTCKGKGVSFMEDDNNWHYRVPNPEEMKKAFAELGVPW